MAARKPLERQPQSFDGTVDVQRVEGVFRAGRLETADRREHGRDEAAVELDRRSQKLHAQAHERSPVPSSLRWAARTAAARSSTRLEKGRLNVPGRATRT